MRVFTLFCVFFVFFSQTVQAQTKPDRPNLATLFSEEKLATLLPEFGAWQMYPTANNRVAWERISATLRMKYIEEAEAYLGQPYAFMPATVALEFERNGNRANFQNLSYGRRKQLATLVLAELFEGQGRFLDDIMNGIWTISEETYWGVPAHLNIQKAGYGLADVTEPTVDLFAAETGMLLAWTSYLLGEQLDAISPLIRERIAYEIDRRVLTPNLERTDFWWMNLEDTSVINNWNPWVNSNWLVMVLLMEQNPQKRVRAVHKIMSILDVFIDSYPSDGGCDEGPGYWTRAGASLFDNLYFLKDATNGAIDVFEYPLIQEMGKFVYRAYIGDNHYINYADAAPINKMNPVLVYQYGKQIEDETMMRFGSFLAKDQALGTTVLNENFGFLSRSLLTLFSLQELEQTPSEEPLVRDFWLPETQVFGARGRAGSKDGFYLSAKGGHNNESHNHNDVGSFMVYKDAQPILIDVGVGVYTKQTFSADRYSIWSMQSAFHNLPTLNGIMQKAGREYEARDISYHETNEQVTFSVDIAPAYPSDAHIKTYQRAFTFDRKNKIHIEENYEFESVTTALQLNFMTALTPKLDKEGVIVLIDANHQGSVAVLHYDKKQFIPTFEPIQLSDERMQSFWGERVYRIILTAKHKNRKGKHAITISGI